MISLVGTISGKSLQLLPPDVIIQSKNALNSISAATPLQNPLGELTAVPQLDLRRPIRYDTRCYFNVRSKADISQLNLPHGTDN